MGLTIRTSITKLSQHKVGKLSPAVSRKLAVALAGVADKTSVEAVTVEDLLNYLPSRY
ncbi:MAG: hypothetical protein ABR530_03580, partial [Pyrinomonadaceae bacterium]